MSEIAFYVEGGGDTAQQRAELRQGFDSLLSKLKRKAQEKGIGWKLVCCGGREATYRSFNNALKSNPGAINVLLVDSEGPITALTGKEANDAAATIQHLVLRDKWDLSATRPDRVHLMVQCMQAWIIADPAALATFYGQHFQTNQLPVNLNLENEPKTDLAAKLERATSDQGQRKIPKGRYGKIKHGSQLLKLIDPASVSTRCPRFALLTKWLENTINSA